MRMPNRPPRLLARLVVALALSAPAGLVAGMLAPPPALASTMTFQSGFAAASQLGEGTTWTSQLTFSGSEYYGHVDPLTGLTIHLPAGTGWSIVGFGSCSKETIEKDGWWTCPTDSMAGLAGSLTGLFRFGSETAEETATVQPIFGPSENLYFVAEGQAPIAFTAIIEGHYVSDSPPYGQALVLDVPRVLSVPGAPDMSTTALTLNVGVTREEAGEVFHSVFMPKECPASGFAWAADAVLNEEASAPVTVDYTGPCPGSESPSTTPITPTTGGGSPVSGGGTGGSSGGAVIPPPTTTSVNPPNGTTHDAKPLTTAQKLARALKQCKHDKPTRKRKACEATAKKRYRIKKVRAVNRQFKGLSAQ
jgi:hypothetical protein